jgi:hypothetical protein
MLKQTELSKISFTEEEDVIDLIAERDRKDSNLSKYIVDLSLPLETRIQALNLYHEKEGENTIETINKLIMMYELSGTKILRAFLFEICEKSTLTPLLQSLSAKSLVSHNEKDELGYKAVSIVYPKFGKNIGTPYKIEFVKILMKNEAYKTLARNYFCEIINDDTIDCDYRYKAILGLESSKEFLYFIQEACVDFIKNEKNLTQYRILAGQNLLRQKIEINLIESILLQFAQDVNVAYNVRADATDVLLQLGSENTKALAQKIILNLGIGSKNIHTLYDNAQNIHTKEVEDSVKEALEFLQSFDILEYNGVVITIDYVDKQIMKMAEENKIEEEKIEKIKVAMNRIIMDRALYSRYNCTLSHILLRIWTYISGHEHEEEMKKRLLEELVEMAGTCSSGFAGRLINTISGFGDFSMRISWRDQITANLSGRINKRIQDLDNLTMQEKVMYEMTLETTKYEDRKHFLKFLRKQVLGIREELYHEFKKHITDADFDLYFRAALSMYETGQFT